MTDLYVTSYRYEHRYFLHSPNGHYRYQADDAFCYGQAPPNGRLS